LKIPTNYRDDILLFGNTLNSEEILMSNFICHLVNRGINISIGKRGNILGTERAYGREIFNAELALVGEKDDKHFWEFENTNSKIQDARLTNVPSGKFIHCLIYCDL